MLKISVILPILRESECRRTCRLLLCKHLAWNWRRYMIIWLCILSKGYTSHPSAFLTILSLQLACGLDSHILICVHHSPWSFLGTWRKSWLNSATLQVMCDAISWRWWCAADDVEVRVEGSDRKGSLGDSASLSDLDSKSTFACWILFAGLMVAIHCECSYIRLTCTFFFIRSMFRYFVGAIRKQFVRQKPQLVSDLPSRSLVL